MGLIAPVTGTGGKDFEKPAAGTYTGICNGVYNCGRQEGYKGKPPVQKLLLTFELHKRKGPSLDKSGRIFECSDVVSNTANIKSTLIERYAGPMRGKSYTEEELKALQDRSGGFDPENLLGGCVKITLALGEKSGNPYVETVAALDPEDDNIPDQVTSEVYWDFTMAGETPKRCAWLWEKSLDNPKVRDAAKNAASAVADQLGDMFDDKGVDFAGRNVPSGKFTAPEADTPY